ncbi:conserved domain protein [delta proteobacterium NaphS2]|nr:conserved domain protein [delta proteobacterium NaphS2]
MVRVVVRVEKPYATKPPLAVGLFVRVEIKGRHMPNLAILPRGALHQGDTVWVVDQDDRIQFRKVQVARIEGEQVQVEGGLRNGERVAISPLKTVTDGMMVRPVPRKEDQQG